MTFLDETHDPGRRSWVTTANALNCDFPIQNLPFGRFRPVGSDQPWRIGVAIGDRILDLRATALIDTDDMNRVMAASSQERRDLRTAISDGLRDGSPKQGSWASFLLAQNDAEMTLPCRIGGYTDFYTGIHHATAVGKLFRPDQPLMPNYKWVPIGYHGRTSSILPSGRGIKRPSGQTKGPVAVEPSFGPSKRVDYELELGYVIGPGNTLGDPIAIDQAEEHLFGICLLNDWSARDIQAWEYQPLGPFLAKNFATTLSPWIVTMEALAPFRVPFGRAAEDPPPMPYLESDRNRQSGGLDVVLEVWLQTEAMQSSKSPPIRLTRGRANDAAYWTAAQLVTHHTVNGCNLEPGDLLGSGTLSGPAADQSGSLLELSQGGKEPITLPSGERRTFLEDGDTVIFRGFCEKDGAVRIGLGEARGAVIAR